MYELLISIANYQIPMAIRIIGFTVAITFIILIIINEVKGRKATKDNNDDIYF